MRIRKPYGMRVDVKKNLCLRFVSSLLLAAVLLFAQNSCTKRALDNPPTKGHVIIHVSWNDSTSPPTSGLRFYFYPQNGDGMFSSDASPTGFEGDLPAGSYRVIACSTDARNAVYQSMEDYSTASVSVAAAENRSLSYYAQPSGVYVLRVSDLNVPLQDVVETSSIPDTLSRSMNLNFILLGDESLSSLSGLIRGIQPSVLLATGQARGETGAISFTGTVRDNRATAQVGMLGILDPQGSLPYRNLMDLTLGLKDGSMQTTQVDLTQFLSEALQSNDGNIPLELPLEVELRLINAELVASVKAWNSGSGQGNVK